MVATDVHWRGTRKSRSRRGSERAVARRVAGILRGTGRPACCWTRLQRRRPSWRRANCLPPLSLRTHPAAAQSGRLVRSGLRSRRHVSVRTSSPDCREGTLTVESGNDLTRSDRRRHDLGLKRLERPRGLSVRTSDLRVGKNFSDLRANFVVELGMLCQKRADLLSDGASRRPLFLLVRIQWSHERPSRLKQAR